MKKGQGLSLNTIIIAAIVLIVLIVLWAIFTGRMGQFATGLSEAEKECGSICTAAGHTGGDLSTESNKTTCATGATKIRTVNNGGVTTACCCT